MWGLYFVVNTHCSHSAPHAHSTQTEIEHLARFVVAWDYLCAEEMRTSATAAIEACKTQKTELEQLVAKNKTAQANAEQNMELIKKRRNAVRVTIGVCASSH